LLYLIAMSYLGQLTTVQTIIQRVPVPVPVAISFARRADLGVPSQLYDTTLNPEEIEKAVYKDIPTSTKKEQKITGTNPQKLIVLQSGLEVPAYILQRAVSRKQEAAQAAQEEMKRASILSPLPTFHKIGVFATQKPMQASLVAIILGYLGGQFYYKMKHQQ